MDHPVDYDPIAAGYEGRYQRNDYSGIRRAFAAFLENTRGADRPGVLEVGRGTGHWLRMFSRAEYDAGVARSRAGNSTSQGTAVLRADLRIYGTTGWNILRGAKSTSAR